MHGTANAIIVVVARLCFRVSQTQNVIVVVCLCRSRVWGGAAAPEEWQPVARELLRRHCLPAGGIRKGGSTEYATAK